MNSPSEEAMRRAREMAKQLIRDWADPETQIATIAQALDAAREEGRRESAEASQNDAPTCETCGCLAMHREVLDSKTACVHCFAKYAANLRAQLAEAHETVSMTLKLYDGQYAAVERDAANYLNRAIDAEAKLAALVKERDEARDNYARCAHAIGVEYEPEGRPPYPGPIEAVERYIVEARRKSDDAEERTATAESRGYERGRTDGIEAAHVTCRVLIHECHARGDALGMGREMLRRILALLPPPPDAKEGK